MAEHKGLMKNNNEVEDDDSVYSYGKKVNEYRDIVLDTIKQIEIISARQLKSSGTVYTKENGQWIKIELENTKKIYRQLIDFFEDLMFHYFDNEIKDKLKEIDERLDKKYKGLVNQYVSFEPNKRLKEMVLLTKTLPVGTEQTKPYEEKYEEYEQESYREKLRELLLLFKRKNDLGTEETSSIFD